MNNQYALTIIMSNYNQSEYITEAINSVLSQVVSFKYILVISDDNSCDVKSKEIIKAYADEYDFIIPIFSPKHEGYLANTLKAILESETEYLCFLDADDYWTDRVFLQRAYDFLNMHDEYTIYESNVNVIDKLKEKKTAISLKHKSRTFSKEMFLNGKYIPFTQTTGMFFRNVVFSKGIPSIMLNAIGTRSERSFEGETFRLLMHLNAGLAYYDKRIVGVYRITDEGIWSSLKLSKKYLLIAKAYTDYYKFYNTSISLFANKAYRYLLSYYSEKENELISLNWKDAYIDEEDALLVDDVCLFCMYANKEIIQARNSIYERIKQVKKLFIE